ncbi:MAG: DUF1273 domain-containing protein [Lactobacillus sp.]|nr:DUF1273 domain-containing protein [Lactobacillus sp.]MCH3906286.1 DUF1273 domain-containing protein [Lactobacillus sp.]MCH3990138.1 DUF1273 domain-containing protein [Lactobacillus sp.]MCH4069148.1 DUF1273 domain-containing protein [Lactobacillus sp.]MCI1303865.1 DUF1273 domain-containing protein [Lactobacillus sp.]
MKRLWVTGYRSYEINAFDQKDPKIKVIKYALKNAMQQRLDDDELDWVITGGALGVEQWAAETALTLRDQQVHVAMMTPYADYAKNWNENHQAQFLHLQQTVDFAASTSNQPYQSPVQLRNYENFMLQHTEGALLVYDPDHPGKSKYDYELVQQAAERGDYDLQLLDFYDLQEAAEELAEQENDNFY